MQQRNTNESSFNNGWIFDEPANFRIIVELSANFRERQENENMLFKVEKILHNKIDKRLELLTMEIKEQNKLRFKNLKKNL